MTSRLLSVIVPAHNEALNLPKIIPRIKKLKSKLPLEIIVVQGGSKDKTVEIASKLGVDKVISFKNRRGKGKDFWAACKKASGEFIIQIDADLQFQPEEIIQMYQLLQKGDVVLGSRFCQGSKVEKGSVSLSFRFGHFFLSFLTGLASLAKVSDVMAGFKGFRSSILKKIELETPHFGYEAEIIILCAKKGAKILQMPVTYQKRAIGKSSISAVKDGFLVTQSIVSAFFRKV